MFKREGSNIHSDCAISVSQAILGDEIIVPTLYGDQIIKIAPGTQHDALHRIDRFGVTKLPPNHH